MVHGVSFRFKGKAKDDGFAIDPPAGKSQQVDVMEGLAGVKGLRSHHDSFDHIFNKELDLDIGKPQIDFYRGGPHGTL